VRTLNSLCHSVSLDRVFAPFCSPTVLSRCHHQPFELPSRMLHR
jgi:hypothetical protein